MNSLLIIAAIYLLATSPFVFASTRYGETLCHLPDYFCMTIKRGESWGTLFPDEEEQDIVRRINRMNTPLRAGIIIAVPQHIDRLSVYDISPFPRTIKSSGEKTIYISQKKLAWAAYDGAGQLLWWGPISSGIEQCPGVHGGCTTPTGSFRIIRKKDMNCASTVFPKEEDGNEGGALMPYCMHFYMGYALHGSSEIPGYRASHGCVRLFVDDARWLNEEFVDLPGGEMKGTRVVIDPPDNPNENR